jgi:membrane associated rhomboid family serine protease
MLEDRNYMRRSPFDMRLTATLVLVLVNVAVFILELVIGQFFRQIPVNSYLALSLDGLKHFYLWQLVTYGFLHGGFLHLFFNCWAIYVFGQEIEQAIGRKPFVALYFSAVVFGGLVQSLFAEIFHGLYALPVVGASAAGFGLAAAFAMLFPERVLLLFFILPLRAKYLLLVCGVLTLIGLLRPDDIAHAAHLGGMLAGVLFVRYAMHWDWHWPKLRRSRGPAPRRLVKVVSGTPGLWTRNKSEEDLPADEFLSKEVDPILDKISAHGIQSLTERERRILEAARQKIVRR